MRILIQRVLKCTVSVDKKIVGNIHQGYLIFVGIEDEDKEEDIGWLCNKIRNIRLFDDEQGMMNKSIIEVGGAVLLVSQFTLQASTKKGNRPSYIKAARLEIARLIYEKMIEKLEIVLEKKIETGIFGAEMEVALVNDGPVTIWIDSKNKE